LWFDPGLAGLFITSTLLHFGEDINFFIVSAADNMNLAVNPSFAADNTIRQQTLDSVPITPFDIEPVIHCRQHEFGSEPLIRCGPHKFGSENLIRCGQHQFSSEHRIH
jgi:hypothetical protein